MEKPEKSELTPRNNMNIPVDDLPIGQDNIAVVIPPELTAARSENSKRAERDADHARAGRKRPG